MGNAKGLRIIDPRSAGDSDVVGIGEDLSVDALVWAYGRGIFPWPINKQPLLWFCPVRRAVLDFSQLHIPRRLARLRRQGSIACTIDKAFPRVIAECRAAPRPGQPGTWITARMVKAYIALHTAGPAHSAEAWNSDGVLVGGIYGVLVDGVFSGESMFHTAPNASKAALLHLVDYLKDQGLTWMDIQMMTPHMAALGAREISRNEFLDRIRAAHLAHAAREQNP